MYSDVYLVCLTHALSTEREEVMGLLIGEVDSSKVLHISSVVLLCRSDKQADRVEISPEQQMDASIKAEQLSKELNRPMRVVGWYHSHPHITVWPSHVDVRTQFNYQQMDAGFVGIIFSVFNEDKVTKQNRIEVTCFQSQEFNSQFHRVEVPLEVVPSTSISVPCLDALITIPYILHQEEGEAYDRVTNEDQDLLTRIHNAAVYTKSVSHVLEAITVPLTHNLETRLRNNKMDIQRLQREKEALTQRLLELQQKNASRSQSHEDLINLMD
ncbi:lys-63-specific deubiquitinase BRCC36 [Biomphalaria pfeifferi]|uniref:Lys-63-specific deubiquitinase BRCC36 n=1 Tax=Biomphalaria pfeifferi TaxID=112525 RepID=A0AAD8C5W6_BIOPF|nr:lys-63-specific deubiquitinase BRCC36 [Biomphalaria pfeifferi]